MVAMFLEYCLKSMDSYSILTMAPSCHGNRVQTFRLSIMWLIQTDVSSLSLPLSLLALYSLATAWQIAFCHCHA